MIYNAITMDIVLVALIIMIPAVIIFFRVDTCFYPTLFFVIKFLAGQAFDFEQVRTSVAFQLIVIAAIVITIIFKDRGKLVISDGFFWRCIPGILVFLAFNSCIGLLYGHGLFRIAIDCYKYLEIIIYYFLFRIAWVNNYDLYRGLRTFTYTMLIIGTLEIFVTSRGGVGLNLIMSLFPMILTLSIYGYIKGFRVILMLSFLIVATCQTRTYIVGFLVGFIFLIVFLPKEKHSVIIDHTVLLGIIAAVVIGIFGGMAISKTLIRFAELSSGFEESGGYRIYDYIEAINRFKDHPVFGNGFGYLKWTYIEKMGWMNWGDFVHCLYLEILFKVGSVGAIFLVCIFGRFAKRIFCEIDNLKHIEKFMFSICSGGLAAFISWLVVYTFAPLSSMGSLFMGPLIASIALSNYYNEVH